MLHMCLTQTDSSVLASEPTGRVECSPEMSGRTGPGWAANKLDYSTSVSKFEIGGSNRPCRFLTIRITLDALYIFRVIKDSFPLFKTQVAGFSAMLYSDC